MNTAQRKLVAVVVTFNRLEKLKTTLARLFDAPASELAQVVVVDNLSTDGTREWLASLTDSRLDLVLSDTNEGGAGGFSRGMRHAVRAHDPDWLVVMDDDGRPEPGALSAFHALPDDKWDAIAAAVYFPSGQICEMNRPSRNPFWRGREFLKTALLGGGRGGFHLDPSEYEGLGASIDVTSFVGFFISRRAIEKIGYPDPSLFIYGDDGIYTLQLTAAGGRIGFEPGLRFEHDLTSFKGNGEVQRGRLAPMWKIYFYHRNLLILYRLAAGVFFWPAMLVILPKWLLNARHYGADKQRFRRLLRYAIRDGLRGRTSVELPEVKAWSGEA